ncbi:hypothetical protein PAECIP112173_00557 [Paenibacillus sp. JJ-100]|nr:hypothetical protein PAECIP112173_00557 [Paenibacillus sp. JJ-100]
MRASTLAIPRSKNVKIKLEHLAPLIETKCSNLIFAPSVQRLKLNLYIGTFPFFLKLLHILHHILVTLLRQFLTVRCIHKILQLE